MGPRDHHGKGHFGGGMCRPTVTYDYCALYACRRKRIYLSSALGWPMFSPPPVTSRRCGLLPNYFGHLLQFYFSCKRPLKRNLQACPGTQLIETVYQIPKTAKSLVVAVTVAVKVRLFAHYRLMSIARDSEVHVAYITGGCFLSPATKHVTNYKAPTWHQWD